MNDNKARIELAEKAFKRGGDYLYRVFHCEKNYLSSEDCMFLKNTYGIPVHCVILMAISHGFPSDQHGFAKLLDEQDERDKGRKNCLLTEVLEVQG